MVPSYLLFQKIKRARPRNSSSQLDDNNSVLTEYQISERESGPVSSMFAYPELSIQSIVVQNYWEEETTQNLFDVQIQASNGHNFSIIRSYSEFKQVNRSLELCLRPNKSLTLCKDFPRASNTWRQCFTCGSPPEHELELDMNYWLSNVLDLANEMPEIHNILNEFVGLQQNCEICCSSNDQDTLCTCALSPRYPEELLDRNLASSRRELCGGWEALSYYLCGGWHRANCMAPSAQITPRTPRTPMTQLAPRTPMAPPTKKLRLTLQPEIDWELRPLLEESRRAFFSGPRHNGLVSRKQAQRLLEFANISPNLLDHQVWLLADVDGDGRLDLEEFALAMYLCRLAAEGNILPVSLPQSLVPPSKRHMSPAPQVPKTPHTPRCNSTTNERINSTGVERRKSVFF